MPVKFLTSEYAYYKAASFLDTATSFSVHCRVRIDTVGTSSQFMFRHRNGTTGDQISLRKGSTGDNANRFRWSITAGGVLRNIDSTITPSAGTVYDLMMTWQQGLGANGLSFYVNGALDGSGSDTTTQGTYETSGTGNLFLAARESTIPSGTEYGQCTLEHLAIWKNVVLGAGHAAALYDGAWPHQLGVAAPVIFLPFFGDQVSTLLDWSGNLRHIVDGQGAGSPATDIFGGAVEANYLRPIQDPWPDQGSFHGAGASGGASPNPWELHNTYTHPTVSVVLSGLTGGADYELKVTAVDEGGNESVDSSVVEAEAQGAQITHTPKLRFIG